MLGTYALYQEVGVNRLVGAMAQAAERDAYGVEYLAALLTTASLPPAVIPRLWLPGVPAQATIDRPLSDYERWARGAVPMGAPGGLPAGALA